MKSPLTKFEPSDGHVRAVGQDQQELERVDRKYSKDRSERIPGNLETRKCRLQFNSISRTYNFFKSFKIEQKRGTIKQALNKKFLTNF